MAVTQTVLPVILADNRIIGGITIASTSFDGTETSKTVGGVSVPLRKVYFGQTRLAKYGAPEDVAMQGWVMAASYTNSYSQESFPNRPWDLGSSFVSIVDLGTVREWYQVAGISQQREVNSSFMQFMLGQKAALSVGSVSVDSFTTNSTAAMSWKANATFSNAPICSFFDFDAGSVFAVSLATNKEPLKVVVTSNPANSHMKAYVVPNTLQAYGRNAGKLLTVRILKVEDVTITPGDYDFTFDLYDIESNVTSVTLTLTVS